MSITPAEDSIIMTLVRANRRLSTGEVAKGAGLSWATTEKYLEILRAKGAVSFTWIGNAKYWRVHEDAVSHLMKQPVRSARMKIESYRRRQRTRE